MTRRTDERAELVREPERVRDSVDVSKFDESEFPGLSHEEVLALEIPPTRQLVAGLIEAGTVGTIAALPETYKSWLALELAHKVAAGGTVLGRCEVVASGPVGYWWQDDSQANEAGRVQEYAGRHGYTQALPIRWHLNEGLRLPDGIPALRAEVERERQAIVFLDSYYNFLSPKLELKAEVAAVVLAAVKAELCDPTGCTVCFVDHTPWPTEGNEGRRRGYGSVFKAAVIRWGIYLEQKGDTLYLEARGNNLAGLKRTAAVWNSERLELQLVEPTSPVAELVVRIEEFLRRNPGATTSVVRAGVEGKATSIDALLAEDDRFSSVPPTLFGKRRDATCWALTEDVPGLLGNTPSPDRDGVGTGSSQVTNDNPVPSPDTPVGGEGGTGSVVVPVPEPGRGSDEGNGR